MPHPDPSAVLAAVARLVAENPSLTEVVSRLAVLLREGIAFDQLFVLRLDRPESLVAYAATPAGEVQVTAHRIGGGPPPAAPVDPNAHSQLLCTIRQGAHVLGATWLTAAGDDAFGRQDQTLMDGVADLLALAIQAAALKEREFLRRERIDSLQRLLHTMAGALDVRQVFPEVSEVVRGGLPHDFLVLTAWDESGTTSRIYAVAGATAGERDFWEPIQLSEAERARLLHRDPYIVHDAEEEFGRSGTQARWFSRLGARSAVRVPLPLGTGVFGSLFVASREVDRFTEADIDFARRVADHLALALSHQHLAEAAATAAKLEAQVATLTRELEARGGVRRVVGHSKQWKDVLAQATRVAQTETTVLLTGESGTGKEVVARFLHHASRRNHGPFTAINCAALPDQLLESELFGHERGAFTGAVATKPGRIEQAAGGVLFLDEVGEMAPTVQAKLLRVLEEREFMRLGSTRVMKADIRVIAATNRDLHTAIQRGEFREDLYYRLGVFEIHLPPLRERLDDILELADTFLAEIGESVGRPAAGISRDAKDQLLTYKWPGNVRELRNAIERAVILADGGHIRGEHLPVTSQRLLPAQGPSSGTLAAGAMNLGEIERSLVVNALAQARYNKTRAAKLLGLTRAQLYSRIEKYGLEEREH
jgi:transcriptional regulator with GAF, ATPase, and Fis domain